MRAKFSSVAIKDLKKVYEKMEQNPEKPDMRKSQYLNLIDLRAVDAR